jgi:ADP-ribosyl-[dinitrogen reductase] hydrolase
MDVIELKKDRAMGAIMGNLIGEALSLGCHWYYDIDALRRDYGTWVSDYADQNTDRTDRFGDIARLRHEQGLKAGDVAQTGQVVILLLESLAACGQYDEADFTRRLDDLLNTLDGTNMSGRFTNWFLRDVWKQRKAGVPWSECGGFCDTAEAASRLTILAAWYSGDTKRLLKEAHRNALLTHRDPSVIGQSLAFALVTASFIEGVSIDEIIGHMRGFASDPFVREYVTSADALQQIRNGTTANDPEVDIEAHLVCRILGLPCTMGFMVPAAYFFIHRYPNDFENAVLSAVNGGGNNMDRASLTGTLSGAMVGLSGIPKRFITGLNDHERLLGLAETVASLELA